MVNPKRLEAETFFNYVEDSILYLLEGKQYKIKTREDSEKFISKARKVDIVEFDQSSIYLPYVPQRSPKNPLIIANPDRVFTCSDELLLQPLENVIGVGCEFALLENETVDDNYIKWTYIRRLPTKPKGLISGAPLGSSCIYYEMQYKFIPVNSKKMPSSVILIFAYVPKYKKFYAMVENQSQLSMLDKKVPEEAYFSFVTAASLLEDSRCNYFFTVTITAVISITTYVLPDAVKELFKLREEPKTDTGRKRPIIHWVCKHLRSLPVNFGYVEIPEYLRGITEFDIDGFHVKIKSPLDQRANK